MNLFIQNIVESQKVFILEHKEEIASVSSISFQNDVGEPVPVICFWSNKDLAKAGLDKVWNNYRIIDICLATFIEDYLVNIYNESLIVGLNYNEFLEGTEADPLDVIAALIDALNLKKLDLEFEYFKNINDLQNQLKKLIS